MSSASALTRPPSTAVAYQCVHARPPSTAEAYQCVHAYVMEESWTGSHSQASSTYFSTWSFMANDLRSRLEDQLNLCTRMYRQDYCGLITISPTTRAMDVWHKSSRRYSSSITRAPGLPGQLQTLFSYNCRLAYFGRLRIPT